MGVTACALSAGVITAAPASAASRQFTVTNNSSATLRLEGVTPVTTKTVCAAPYSATCAKGHYPIEFEGRPNPGTDLAPGGIQRFDLKYDFSFVLGSTTRTAHVQGREDERQARGLDRHHHHIQQLPVRGRAGERGKLHGWWPGHHLQAVT